MFETVKAAKRSCEKDLLANENVVGVGVGFRKVGGKETGEVCIIVSVVEKGTYRVKDEIPETVRGIKTDVQQTGRFYALRMSRHRPAPGGVSIGHTAVTAGTLGCLVWRDGKSFILSNNHVLANSNLGRIGDSIVQPGIYDKGIMPDDEIATLADFVKVNFLLDQLPECPTAIAVEKAVNWLARLCGSNHRVCAFQDDPLGMNLVDAAIARPLFPDWVTPKILEIGVPTGAVVGELGMPIQKSGRTTGLTYGRIAVVDLTVQVQYGGPTDIALFTDQMQADAGCGGGDSGSAVLSGDKLVGLLFAGPQDGSSLIMNRFEHVRDLLGVTILPKG